MIDPAWRRNLLSLRYHIAANPFLTTSLQAQENNASDTFWQRFSAAPVPV